MKTVTKKTDKNKIATLEGKIAKINDDMANRLNILNKKMSDTAEKHNSLLVALLSRLDNNATKEKKEPIIEAEPIQNENPSNTTEEVFDDEAILADESDSFSVVEVEAKTEDSTEEKTTALAVVGEEPELLKAITLTAQRVGTSLVVLAKKNPYIAGALTIAAPIAVASMAKAAGLAERDLSDMVFGNGKEKPFQLDDGFSGKIYKLSGISAKEGLAYERQIHNLKTTILARRELKDGDSFDIMCDGSMSTPPGFRRVKIIQSVKFSCGREEKILLGWRFKKNSTK